MNLSPGVHKILITIQIKLTKQVENIKYLAGSCTCAPIFALYIIIMRLLLLLGKKYYSTCNIETTRDVVHF